MRPAHTFRAGFLFAGLGAGARGFDLAESRLGGDRARFSNVGGIDIDALACRDYEYLTKGPGIVGNLSGELDPEWPDSPPLNAHDLRRLWPAAPDVLFASPPCKGHSGLLSSSTAETEKYQRMNALVHQGLFNVMEAWETPPGLIVLENVPRVTSRGAQWLIQVRQNLAARGYVFHEEAHDLRLIGDLGAHRRRYLLVARHPRLVPAYVFRPPLKPGKSCGDILAELPLPETEAAGPMHRLPRLSLLNWIRLALIPPGGDWRDLPGMRTKETDDGDDERGDLRGDQPGEGPAGPEVGRAGARRRARSVRLGAVPPPAPDAGVRAESQRRGVAEADGSRGCAGGGCARVGSPQGSLALDHAPRRGALGVMDAAEPAATVRGRADVRTGPAAVADGRLDASALKHNGSVCENAQVSDPRVVEQLAPGACADNAAGYKGRPHYLGVNAWEEPSRTVVGKGRVGTGSGPSAVADPRLGVNRERFKNSERVGAWDQPAGTITTGMHPSNGGGAVADPRVAMDDYIPPVVLESDDVITLAPEGPRYSKRFGGGAFGVRGFDEPAATICGESYPSNGAASVADPRIPLGNKGPAFNDILKVGEWGRAAPTVTGAPKPHGGTAVADPRLHLGCTPHPGAFGVVPFTEPAPTVTGNERPTGSNTPASVADPRIPITCTPRETSGAYGVLDPARPAYAVTGHGQVDNGPLAVADSRARFGNCDRVTAWDQPTGTVTHAPAPSSGGAATADPRIAGGAALPPTYRRMTLDEALRLLDAGVKQLPDGQVPVILSPKDGTWHRPLTDLELAALQGLPATLDGAPLQLAGKSRAKHRERIGNAVPVGAAKAIAESLLTALLAAATGQWVLGSTGIWVRRDDGRPAEEMEAIDAA